MIYVAVSIVSFILGFWLASRSKDNISIGFGNQTITMVDGEIEKKKK